jgi:hypothetical protein
MAMWRRKRPFYKLTIASASLVSESGGPTTGRRARAGRGRCMAPFLSAERFASQFGTQQARDYNMLEGLKKAGFR